MCQLGECAAERGNYTHTTGGKVTSHPPSVTVTVLLVAEHGLEGVTESEVERLSREITQDVGGVSTPERDDTLVGGGATEAVGNTLVLVGETAGLQHLVLRKQTH